MKKNIFLTALTRAVVMLVVPTCSLFAADLPPGFAEKAVAEGLNPAAMAMAPDGSLFLAQKDGRVLLLHDDELHTEPFLTLAVDDFNERGLEGIAVHPNFGQEPWVYLYYTVPGASRNRVSRVLANGGFAVPGSEQVLLELDPMNGAIHNGGALVFGPDGCLYIGVGDGAAPAKAQNLNTVLGKILRLNPDGSIPASNPFYGQLAGNSRAIFASGVRNPFSMACDPATGKILFCDVGLGSFEEVNELKPGKNYGWNLIEGPLNGQTPPTDYQDPFFAYPHGPQTGCAVVGAAFGLGNQPGIPPTFQRRFFFADYCSGWIRTLDPTTGMLADTFATGIDRPVSLLVGPVGELYYFARAGLGGGSPGDNTASVEGTLWKVFWVGDSTPLVAGHPRDAHVAAGETALFSAKAFGAQPITYQWLINAMPVPGADSSVLALANTMPTDSGAQIVCVAANLFGSDTSHTAVLCVTDGKRPLPEILLPFANTTYRCGDTIFFRGRATDPDEGLLADSRLTWRVDFHHAAHTHPALPTIAGVSEGMIAVPTVGETAADVFFRIHLTATDTTGLSRSAALDVLPKLTKFFLDGPPGLPVNINGQIRPLPADVSSVIGMQHSLLATLFFQNGDTLFYFRDWENGSTETLRTVYAAETPDTLAIRYDRIVLGNGTGLHGAYFFDPLATLPDPPALVRTDTTIHFDWGEGTPDSVSLPSDYFTVRWTGFVEPVFGETYQFHIRSDDGARLWVGDSLLLDQWVPQVITEHSGSIFLKNGVRYPIRLEYLEIGGGALAELRWSSARQVKQIVPKRQLYPPDTLRASTVTGTVGIDQNLDGIWSAGETLLPNVEVALYAAANDSLLAVKKTLGNGRYRFDHLLPEAYYLRFRPGTTAGVLAPSENVDTEGFTAAFNLAYREIKTLNAAWIVDQAALYGSVWLDENRNDLWDVNEHGLDKVGILLYRGDSTLAAATATNADGGYLFPLVPAGAYFLWFSNHLVGLPTVPGFGLDSSGRVPFFDINTGGSRYFIVAFKPEGVSTTGDKGASEARSTLRVWPNPADERLYVALEMEERQNVVLEIFDLHGRSVFQKTAVAVAGENSWPLNVAELKPGMYTVLCRGGGEVWARRWVRMED